MFKILLILVSVAQLSVAQAAPTKTIVQDGDFAVNQLVSPGFERLTPERRLFAFRLAQAMRVTRDIYWIQASREGLAIRELLTELWTNSIQFPRDQKRALGEYFFRVLAERRNYDKFTNAKFYPNLSVAQFRGLVALAGGEKLRAEAARLERDIFDPTYRATLLASTPLDRVADSNSNFYGAGVTDWHLEGLELDSLAHVAVNDGLPVVTRPRIDGLYGSYLRKADRYLESALEFATPSEVLFIGALRTAFRDGTQDAWTEAFAAWLRHKPTDLDFMMGFVEKYDDPLGARRAWESWIVVLSKDPETDRRGEAIRAHAVDFEAAMPVDPAYRKQGEFIAPLAEGNELLFTAGASGEMPFLGKNLFSDPELRKIGNKNFVNINMLPDENLPVELERAKRFFLPEYYPSMDALDLNLLTRVQIEFHEILGHGSGQLKPGVTTSDLKEYYSPIEEARAEVASLYHMLGDLPSKFGILPEGDDVKTITLVAFFTHHIMGYYRIADGVTEFRQAHQWARQTMLNDMLDKGCLTVEVGTVPMFRMTSVEVCRQALGDLWARLQDLKSRGNYAGAATLLKAGGVLRADQIAWRSLMRDEFDRQQRPRYRVRLNPRLMLTRDGKDVEIDYRREDPRGVTNYINEQIRIHQGCENELM